VSEGAPSRDARAPAPEPGRDRSSASRPRHDEDRQHVGAPALAASSAAAKRPASAGSPTPDERLLLIALARADFWCFVELMFPVLYPAQKLVYAPYLELIATLLMRVDQGLKRNVIINLPPRHMKSALVSVLYTAWRLGRDPTTKFICISYGDDLAHDLSSQTRKIMRSECYRSLFPKTILDKSAVDHIRTTQGGYRYATAVGSDITGFGADEIIIDDPVQPEDVHSERVMQKVRDWVESSVRTRFNDPSKGAMILVMHRLAPDDLSGTLEPHADFVLKLPLIAEKRERFIFHNRDLMVREIGDPLNPARTSREEAEKLKARMAPHVFEGQYQQRPQASTSGYCDIMRLVRYADPPAFEVIVHSWDIAATKGGGDWTVCAKFGLARDAEGKDRLYLIGLVRLQVELPEVREAIIGHDRLDRPSLIIMDGNGVGRGVYQDLWRRGFRHLLAGETMTTSATDNLKARRFNEALFYLYDGFVLLPESMPGLDKLFDEMAAFPDGKHDDQVDALCTVAAYHPRVVQEARRLGRKSGRLKEPAAPKPAPPPKSRDQELHERRQWRSSR
jgi:predicted phage terminase large subunit-like protein